MLANWREESFCNQKQMNYCILVSASSTEFRSIIQLSNLTLKQHAIRNLIAKQTKHRRKLLKYEIISCKKAGRRFLQQTFTTAKTSIFIRKHFHAYANHIKKIQPNIKTHNLTNKIAGLQSYNQATKDSYFVWSMHAN